MGKDPGRRKCKIWVRTIRQQKRSNTRPTRSSSLRTHNPTRRPSSTEWTERFRHALHPQQGSAVPSNACWHGPDENVRAHFGCGGAIEPCYSRIWFRVIAGRHARVEIDAPFPSLFRPPLSDLITIPRIQLSHSIYEIQPRATKAQSRTRVEGG